MTHSDMSQRVEDMVADIPPGRVMTYGDVAACCGYPGAARQVGAIAHQGTPGLPWHRVVASTGRLTTMQDSSSNWQSEALSSEGVTICGDKIIGFEQVRWYPELF